MSLARNPASLYHISYKGLLAAQLKLLFFSPIQSLAPIGYDSVL
jgi:hypothetical protein